MKTDISFPKSVNVLKWLNIYFKIRLLLSSQKLNGTFLLDCSKGLEWNIQLNSNTEMETHYYKSKSSSYVTLPFFGEMEQ